ncbi:MAG: protein kinase domain-containing protein, partial [Pirellula sp.]
MRENHEDQGDLELDQVLLDFLKRHDRGELVDRETFLREHPEYADRLQELLAAADWIETMAGPTFHGGVFEGETRSDANAEPESPSASEDSHSNYDPNAVTLDLKTQGEDLEKKRAMFSFVDAPLSSDTDFSLSDVPSLDGTQASLPCRFGEYLLERVLGRGGMGVVYLANQVQLNRRVAIKMIRSGALASDEEVARFYSEARSVAKLDHPNIVTV